jgi:hypothetical protein
MTGIRRPAAAVGALVLITACHAARPSTVPEGAVYMAFSSSGGWAHCWLDPTIGLNRCRTYSADGRRLYRFGHENDDDDVFVRYEGAGPVPEEQLKFDVAHSSPDFLWLQNDVVLIPRNDFEHQKQFVGELMRAGAKGSP